MAAAHRVQLCQCDRAEYRLSEQGAGSTVVLPVPGTPCSSTRRPCTVSGGLIYALVYSFIPFPAAPYEYAPLVDGIWLFLGLVILGWMWRRHDDRWLLTAGAALDESEETDTAPAARPN